MIFLSKFKDRDRSVQVAIAAQSYAEAEGRAVKIMQTVCRDGAELESIAKTAVKEVLEPDENPGESMLYYRGKIACLMDSGKGKLKTAKLVILVRASSDREAFELLKAHAEGFLDPARVFGLEETELLDYYDEDKYRDLDSVPLTDLLRENRIRVSYQREPPELPAQETGAALFENGGHF